MEEFMNVTVFDVMRVILFWVSPVVFLVGLFLVVTAQRYSKFESVINKEIGGIRKRIVPKLETNIFHFHEWLLKRAVIIGFLCMALSVLFFLASRKPLDHLQ